MVGTPISTLLPRRAQKSGSAVESWLVLLGFVAPTLLPMGLGAQTAHPPIWITADSSGLFHSEVHLAASPADPHHLFAAAGAFPDGKPHRVDGFESRDGGMTWQRLAARFPRRVAGGGVIDPWVTFTEDGQVFVSALAYEGERSLGDRLVPWLLKVEGTALRPAATVSSGALGSFDAPRLSTVPGGEALLIVANRWASKSARGNSRDAVVAIRFDLTRNRFEEAVHVVQNNAHHAATNVVAMPDGDLILGAAEWSVLGSESAWLGRLHTSVSPDSGRSFSPLSVVPVTEGRGYRWLSAAPLGSPGLLHLIYADPDTANLMVVTSDSRGERWGNPVTVAGFPSHPVFSAVATDDKGRVGVLYTWPRVTNERVCTTTWFAVSGSA